MKLLLAVSLSLQAQIINSPTGDSQLQAVKEFKLNQRVIGTINGMGFIPGSTGISYIINFNESQTQCLYAVNIWHLNSLPPATLINSCESEEIAKFSEGLGKITSIGENSIKAVQILDSKFGIEIIDRLIIKDENTFEFYHESCTSTLTIELDSHSIQTRC